jgi:hypothetical protein
MPRYQHLQLVRLPERFERRKRRAFGGIKRDAAVHGPRLAAELDAALHAQRERRSPAFIDPSLILRVTLAGNLTQEQWDAVGVTVLSSDADRSLILCASAEAMQEIQRRVGAYSAPPPPGQIHPQYSGTFSAIESIGAVTPRDRIGFALKEGGFGDPADFDAAQDYTLDVELWDVGIQAVRQNRIAQLRTYVEQQEGRSLDAYIGPSISLMRIRASGTVIRTLLEESDVASIDLPPQADVETEQFLDHALRDLPPLTAPDADAPVIGVLDTGVNDTPLLEGALIGSIGEPPELGTADDRGHGTRIAGIAVFGDIRAQLADGRLIAGARVCSARVLEHGDFVPGMLVPSQMRTAISRLRDEFGARIFVLAMADRGRPYRGGKVGTWAATLDEIARSMDVLIIIPTGNRLARSGERVEEGVTEYPDYLLEEGNRMFEPAGAVNVLTVGALAHANGLDGQAEDDVHVRPITDALEPSPFTRVGPGMDRGTKPDVVDLGGTHVFSAVAARLLGGDERPSAGMLTLHHRPLERLITSGSGTSYAVPMVAYKCAHLLRVIPTASANLLRALVIGAADVPDAAQACLAKLGQNAVKSICGNGFVSLERAAYSDDARAVLHAEDELVVDHFAVYEIPIPALFQAQAGTRKIRVTLAYDPPVRHTREDYAGVSMNFRLLRGVTPEFVFEHFRRRVADDPAHPALESRYNCELSPGPRERELSTLQTATATFHRNISAYGDRYFLVVRCERGWADATTRQRFAVVVELAHEAEIRLYEQLRVRLNV